MQRFLNATDVRSHWGQFNDDVVREGPKFVKRNRDKWVALSMEHLSAAFETFTFQVDYLTENDGTITATLRDFDIVENADNEEEALDLIVDELIEYANEYQGNFNQYFNSPNRKNHFPYIMNVLAQKDSDQVRSLINA